MRSHSVSPPILSIGMRAVGEAVAIRPQITAWQVRQEYRARRNRDRYFPGVTFEDPAWDMLLDLYASHLEGRQVSVSSLAIAASVPKTTAYRWIDKMTDDGLFVWTPDPLDGRRFFISLSEAAAQNMQRYFSALPPLNPQDSDTPKEDR